MAISKGWDGEVQVGTDKVAYINSWEINFNADALENTAFGDTVYDRSYQPGLRAHTISASGYMENIAGSTAQAALLNEMRASTEPTAVTLKVLYDNDTEKGWTGSCVITGITVGSPVDGLSPFSGNFQVSGGLSTVQGNIMAISRGWKGSIEVNNDEIGSVNNWEVAFNGDALENTAFGDTVYDRGFQPGLRNHTITFSGYCDAADAGQQTLLDSMKTTQESELVTIQCFYDRDKPGWGGSAVVTGITIGTPVDGLASINGTLQISGGLKPYLSGVITEGILVGDPASSTNPGTAT